MKFASKIVIAVVVMNIVATIAFLWAFVKVGSEPAVLIGAWFTFTTTELWALASIKKAKVRKLRRSDNDV